MTYSNHAPKESKANANSQSQSPLPAQHPAHNFDRWAIAVKQQMLESLQRRQSRSQ